MWGALNRGYSCLVLCFAFMSVPTPGREVHVLDVITDASRMVPTGAKARERRICRDDSCIPLILCRHNVEGAYNCGAYLMPSSCLCRLASSIQNTDRLISNDDIGLCASQADLSAKGGGGIRICSNEH